ncbi:MAG: TfoX/Sxy family protein [Candidatus Omnitrophica bacterium]|nr:TfoX/Sxy family protein [Candidatus Omnitrophota bacterium]
MASDLDFVEFVKDQIDPACAISFRKMFGEYALYSKGKVVALICDNQLFVKSTDAGKKYIGEYIEAPAYPGAKQSLLIQEQIEDREWLSKLIIITENEFPMPKPKVKRKAKK